MIVRPADPADGPAILGIWNPIIRDTLVTFSSAEQTPGTLAALIAARRAAGHEFLVAAEGAALLGFATYRQFRAGDGYVHAMEHTVLLAESARGRGAGRALMRAAEAHAAARGAHVMMAGVSAANPDGIAFHGAIGYREVARVPEVGRKFGRWLDLVLMQKVLSADPGQVK